MQNHFCASECPGVPWWRGIGKHSGDCLVCHRVTVICVPPDAPLPLTRGGTAATAVIASLQLMTIDYFLIFCVHIGNINDFPITDYSQYFACQYLQSAHYWQSHDLPIKTRQGVSFVIWEGIHLASFPCYCRRWFFKLGRVMAGSTVVSSKGRRASL